MDYIYCALWNSERQKVQNSLYLLSFLQFGGVASAKEHIFTVLFAIWRGKKCETAKVQNSKFIVCDPLPTLASLC